MKKVFYWSPHLSNVATIKNVVNSAYSLKKYNSNLQVSIIDAIGEWTKFKNIFKEKKIGYQNLKSLDLSPKLPITGYFNSRFFSVLIFLKNFFPLKTLLYKEKPDYLIVHLITSLPLLLAIIFNLKTKIILRISGLPKLHYIRKLFWRIASKKIYYITCASDETKNDLIKLNIFEKEKIITLHDPIIFISEIIKFKKEKISKFMEKENIFVSIGRLTNQKNHLLLIKMFSQLNEKDNKYFLYIIGDGENKDSLNKEIKKLNLSKYVFLLGYKENVFPYIKSANAVLSSSLWEDPGAVMIEAAFCNTLVISSDCMSGPKEFLENEKAGYLFENNNIKSLKNSLDKFFNENLDKKKEKKILAKKNSKKYTIFNHYLALKKIIN